RGGGPHDDQRQGDRRRGAAAGPDGARRRHPSDRRHAAPVGRRHHRHDQGEQGAEQLLGAGDMLYMMAGGRIRRIHGPFVTDHEVEDVVRFLKTQGTPSYLDAVTEEPEEDGDDPYALMGSSGGNSESGDDLYDK